MIRKRALVSLAVMVLIMSATGAARADGASQPPSPPGATSADAPDAGGYWQSYWGLSVGGLLALPYGREGARWSEATPGFAIGGRLGFTPIPVTLGLDIESLWGNADKFDADVWSDSAGRDVSTTVKRELSMVKLDLSLRLQPYWQWLPVRPYLELVAGVQITWTQYTATVSEEEIQWSDNTRATGALAWGLGVDVLLSHNLGVTFGVRRYYGPNVIASHEVLVEDVNARVQYGKPTQLTTFMLGVVGAL